MYTSKLEMILVMPVGVEANKQKLIRIIRKGIEGFHREELCNVRFVPLVGQHGWQS